MKKDPRVTSYIKKAQPFARPVLLKLRALIHKGAPQVTETIKWGMPSFEYKGPLCSFAAFKQHAVFGFWKYKLIKDPKGYLGEIRSKGGASMGNLGRIGGLKDLPPDRVFLNFMNQAVKLNEQGVKQERVVNAKAPLRTPAYFRAALKKNKRALATFDHFSPSAKRDYIEWITEARSDETRNARLRLALEWMAEGKRRNWKYER